MARLIRELRVGSRGDDVYAIKRCVHRFLGNKQLQYLEEQPINVRRTFGVYFRTHVKNAQKKLRVDQTGVVNNALLRRLKDADAMDAYAEHLLEKYEAANAKPIVKPVEPKQGWKALDPSLHELFSIGRHYGFSDLGVWNPLSRLPSGRPSDHAVYPALAFDLGFTPATGWNNQKARDFFRRCTERSEVSYVIAGDRIWSRARAHEGARPYTYGGHEGHVHVSGRRL